ncbi:MAG: HAD family hydrolase [Clostridia bacterium]|nr:HAD family hydrolase [Clostridia bacterium]
MVPFLCSPRRNILFDLDGTLLPMDMKEYIRIYFEGLTRRLSPIPADTVYATLTEGIGAMMKNTGEKTNRQVFADVFTRRTGVDYYAGEEDFLQFYLNEYNRCMDACSPTPLAAQIISLLQKKGYNVIIATSPLYPPAATQARLRWAGIDRFDYPLVTTFHDFYTAKPNPDYYREVCARLGTTPGECIMVGNDVEEDGAALETGMEVILVTDCILNGKKLPTDGLIPATLRDVLTWAESLPALA